ncbi:PASTA domain-containing protein [Micromonospora citrea]|uniref:PASTA domain-containing protein n=1 Tax=Micromonospora citrea TaxID=47855 RepID=UPI003C5F2A31
MSDDRQEPADDATRPLPPPEDRAAAAPPPADTTARHEPLDATAPQEPIDRTRPLPPTDAGPSTEPAPTVWSGRAGVPPPRPAEYQPAEWYGEEQRPGRWWMPILLGILALLLLGALGAGIWLALRAADERDDDPTPPPLPTSAPATTAAPTSAAPTTEPPSTAPTTAAARVPMPPLVGQSRATAERILDRIGLSYRVESRESAEQAPGTVIETDPEAGEPVRPGEDEVTLVVATAPSPSPSATDSDEPTPEPSPTP